LTPRSWKPYSIIEASVLFCVACIVIQAGSLRNWCSISGIGKRFFFNFPQGCFGAYPVPCAMCTWGYFPEAKVAVGWGLLTTHHLLLRL